YCSSYPSGSSSSKRLGKLTKDVFSLEGSAAYTSSRGTLPHAANPFWKVKSTANRSAPCLLNILCISFFFINCPSSFFLLSPKDRCLKIQACFLHYYIPGVKNPV